MPKRANVFFSGSVQGVGFRYAALNAARGHPVTGWVRNLSDGRVEVMAEGTQEALEAFIAEVENDMSGYIDKKIVRWGEASGEFHEFAIKSTL